MILSLQKTDQVQPLPVHDFGSVLFIQRYSDDDNALQSGIHEYSTVFICIHLGRLKMCLVTQVRRRFRGVPAPRYSVCL